jgi:structural maintenance of chromosome 3 (chondroitin sulfate proteoglycan 6)
MLLGFSFFYYYAYCFSYILWCVVCLGELEREKEELKEYDFLDKKRRALQFTLYDKELTKVTSQLETVETSRSEQIQSQQELFSRLRELQDQLVMEEEGLAASRQALDRLVSRREGKANEVREATSLRSQLQVDLQEAQSVGTAKIAALEDCRAKLLEVQVRHQTTAC